MFFCPLFLYHTGTKRHVSSETLKKTYNTKQLAELKITYTFQCNKTNQQYFVRHLIKTISKRWKRMLLGGRRTLTVMSDRQRDSSVIRRQAAVRSITFNSPIALLSGCPINL